MPEWKHQYFKSCDKYIMAETLSPTFVGLQFKEVGLKFSILFVYLLLIQYAMNSLKDKFFRILSFNNFRNYR